MTHRSLPPHSRQCCAKPAILRPATTRSWRPSQKGSRRVADAGRNAEFGQGGADQRSQAGRRFAIHRHAELGISGHHRDLHGAPDRSERLRRPICAPAPASPSPPVAADAASKPGQRVWPRATIKARWDRQMKIAGLRAPAPTSLAISCSRCRPRCAGSTLSATTICQPLSRSRATARCRPVRLALSCPDAAGRSGTVDPADQCSGSYDAVLRDQDPELSGRRSRNVEHGLLDHKFGDLGSVPRPCCRHDRTSCRRFPPEFLLVSQRPSGTAMSDKVSAPS